MVAGVFGIINLPSTGAWAVMGAKMRRFLSDPVRFVAALLLIASLFPMVAGLVA